MEQKHLGNYSFQKFYTFVSLTVFLFMFYTPQYNIAKNFTTTGIYLHSSIWVYVDLNNEKKADKNRNSHSWPLA